MEQSNNTGFEFDLPKGNSSIIKVIGVGGGGNNALKYMYEKGIHGVDFIICNTDAQTLNENPISNKVQLGLSITEGLGAGADPEVGEKAALESIDEIKTALGNNTKMVFITAGMGGGTGTGAAPVVAKVAKEMGILTVAIVTVPFTFEGKRRLEQADAGLEKLRQNVDSLIVINNDKLRQQFGNLGFKQGFSKADEVLTNAAKGMAEVITAPFVINIDFRDAKSVLQNSGTALMSTGVATGEKRAEEAVKKALDSPLLNDNKITGAKDVLLLILSGSDEASEATMDEIGLINDYVQNEAGGNNNANIIFGVGTDEELGDAIKVLVIATGFAKEAPVKAARTEVVKVPLGAGGAERRESPFGGARTGQPFANRDRGIVNLDEDLLSDHPTNFSEPTTTEMKVVEKKILTIEEQETPEEDFDTPYRVDLFSSSDFSEDAQTGSLSITFNTEETKKTQSNSPFPVKTQPQENIEFKVRDEKREQEEQPQFRSVAPTQQTEVYKEKLEVKNYQESDLQVDNYEDENLFTIIEKQPEDAKVQERRNKLKEFNARYQSQEEENEFETVPAFRRKNIDIDSPTKHKIDNFLSEQDGRVQLRENRFLNKDVD